MGNVIKEIAMELIKVYCHLLATRYSFALLNHCR